MKFGWFVLGNGPLGNVTLIIGVTGQIGGGLNAGVFMELSSNQQTKFH